MPLSPVCKWAMCSRQAAAFMGRQNLWLCFGILTATEVEARGWDGAGTFRQGDEWPNDLRAGSLAASCAPHCCGLLGIWRGCAADSGLDVIELLRSPCRGQEQLLYQTVGSTYTASQQYIGGLHTACLQCLSLSCCRAQMTAAQQLAASLKSPTSLGLGGAKIRWFGAKERGADLDSAAGRHSS